MQYRIACPFLIDIILHLITFSREKVPESDILCRYFSIFEIVGTFYACIFKILRKI